MRPLTAWLPTTNTASFSSFTGSTVSLITHRMSKLRGRMWADVVTWADMGADVCNEYDDVKDVDRVAMGDGMQCTQHTKQVRGGVHSQQDGGSYEAGMQPDCPQWPSPRQDGVGQLHVLTERLAGIVPPANGVGRRNDRAARLEGRVSMDRVAAWTCLLHAACQARWGWLLQLALLMQPAQASMAGQAGTPTHLQLGHDAGLGDGDGLLLHGLQAEQLEWTTQCKGRACMWPRQHLLVHVDVQIQACKARPSLPRVIQAGPALASWMDTRSWSFILSNSSMRHTPWREGRSSAAEHQHGTAPAANAW